MAAKTVDGALFREALGATSAAVNAGIPSRFFAIWTPRSGLTRTRGMIRSIEVHDRLVGVDLRNNTGWAVYGVFLEIGIALVVVLGLSRRHVRSGS